MKNSQKDISLNDGKIKLKDVFMDISKITKNRIIVTNNEEVRTFYNEEKKGYSLLYELIFIDNLDELFIFVRDLIHERWHLLNNPMAGNIPLHKHPFRSLAMEVGKTFDERSLFLWDEASERRKRGALPQYTNEVMRDFAHIDAMLFTENLPF